jgi:hypothetical protein
MPASWTKGGIELKSFLGNNWKIRWAVILTIVWMVWLGASSIIWEAAATPPDLEPAWEQSKYLSYAASVNYSFSRSVGYSRGSIEAWPVWVDDQELMARLFGEDGRRWFYIYIPDSPSGKYYPFIHHFPPLGYALGAVGLAVFGPESSGPREASALLLLAFVAVMAYHGWQLAGFRGAILLGLAAAASPWTHQWLRFYNYQPGAILMLALAMVAGHSSRGLTRPVFCVCIGVALGVGLLFIQLLMFASAPWLIAMAVPEAFRSRYSLLAGGIILLIFQIVWMRLSMQMHAGIAGSEWLDPYVAWGVMLLLFGLLGTAWMFARKQGWLPAAGLAVTVAVAGLVSAPYYLLFQWVQMRLIEYHSYTTECANPDLFSPLWGLIQNIHTFHWLGLLWLAAGFLFLPCWRGFRKSEFRLFLSVAGGTLLIAYTTPTSLKYSFLLLPLLLVLGFLWAARWKISFIGVSLFLLGTFCIQSTGWLHLDNYRIPRMPVPTIILDSFDHEKNPENPSLSKDQWWFGFPIAELPSGEIWVWDHIPRGLRLSFLGIDPLILIEGTVPPDIQGGSTLRNDDLDCLSMYLNLRCQVVAPQFLKEGDSVLIASVSAFPYSPLLGPGAGSLELSAPVHLQWNNLGSTFPKPVFLQLRKVLSIRESRGRRSDKSSTEDALEKGVPRPQKGVHGPGVQAMEW